MTPRSFDLTGPLPNGRTLIEASAGTGKTYSIAVLVTRFVAGELTGNRNHDLAEGVAIDELLVVTYTRAAAAELRDRIRGKLALAVEYLDGGSLPAEEEWLRVFDSSSPRVRERRSTRLRQALARFDEATITTIHGFCQQALAQSGLRTASGAAELVERDRELIAEVVRDLLLDRLAADPLALSPDQIGRPVDADALAIGAPKNRRPVPPDKVEGYLAATVATVLSNPGARCEPAPSAGGLAGEWAALVGAAVAEIERRQRARRLISYDRLVADLAGALADPVDGPPLAAQLASRFRLVLVDEFQDTDRLQWEIFDRAFGQHRLITVGDPKQAIFRFRGADVHAYLDAAKRAGRAELSINHRADRQLLDALAVLFEGLRLGHEEIVFARVAASSSAPTNALGITSVQLRVVPDEPAVPHTSQGMEAGAAAALVLTDLASRVRTLLDTAVVGSGRSARRLRPSDIGVLVPSQRRAAETADMLREWGIPTVRARTGSVLRTAAAGQWRLLLAGLAAPADARAARAAGLSWFFDVPPAELVDTAERVDISAGSSRLARLQRELATLAERMRRLGVGAVYEQLRSTDELLTAVLGRPNGERDLADLDHLAELLAERSGRCYPGDTSGAAPTEPAHVAELLDRMIADADDQAEHEMRRVETDEEAVQITTVHSAKGLEYPVVLVPFAYTERPRTNRPYVFNDDHGRVVDVASWVCWGPGVDDGSSASKAAVDARKARATAEVDGDSLRLLYVALTRAKHHIEIWWAPTRRSATSALGRILLDRDGAGALRNSVLGAEHERADAATTSSQIDAIVAASNGTIERVDVALDQPVRRPLPLDTGPESLLTIADRGHRHPLADPARRTWSFTAIAAGLAGPSRVAETAGVPLAGGYDEPSADDQLDAATSTSRSPVVGAPLIDAAGGATFGIAVHEVLERVDFACPSVESTILDEVSSAVRRLGLTLDAAAIGAGLRAVVDTPLGVLFDGRSLRDVAMGDRLNELRFDLTFGAARVSAGEIGKLLATTIASRRADSWHSADPMPEYGRRVASELSGVELAGWLTGSIDAVIRVGGPDGRYVVVDYKTNRLHQPGDPEPLAAYRPDRLAAAMAEGHYPLQALLYCVALHRYLSWRLGSNYEPERHLGGVAYLFVRGMIGAPTPTLDGAPYGVFAWRPPAATVLAIDELFRGVP